MYQLDGIGSVEQCVSLIVTWV